MFCSRLIYFLLFCCLFDSKMIEADVGGVKKLNSEICDPDTIYVEKAAIVTASLLKVA